MTCLPRRSAVRRRLPNQQLDAQVGNTSKLGSGNRPRAAAAMVHPAWRHTEALSEDFGKVGLAVEAGCGGDLEKGQVGFGNQASRPVQPEVQVETCRRFPQTVPELPLDMANGIPD